MDEDENEWLWESLAWFNSTTDKKSRDALPKMWKVLRRCFVRWNENIPKIMKICFHALIASEKQVSFICTAYQTMNTEKSQPFKCKRDRINHVPKMSMRESLQNMQVACFNKFGGTQVKLLIWTGHFYSRGTWYMGKKRLTQINYKAMGIIRFRERSILLCPSF